MSYGNRSRRQDIYEYVMQHPGCTTQLIEQNTKSAKKVIAKHLDVLVSKEKVRRVYIELPGDQWAYEYYPVEVTANEER